MKLHQSSIYVDINNLIPESQTALESYIGGQVPLEGKGDRLKPEVLACPLMRMTLSLSY